MGFLDFPESQYFVCPSDDDPTPIGSFNDTEAIELQYIMTTIQKVGAHAGDERMRLQIYPNNDYDAVLYSSDWFDVSDFENISSSSWIGNVRFDFDRNHLRADTTYYLALQLDNYVDPGDESYYWGIALDWPDPVNAYDEANKAGAQASIIGYK